MKQFLAVALVALAVTGICVMTAGASQQGGVTPAKFAKLSKQVKKLSKQVKRLKKQESTDRNVAVTALVYAGCSVAATADAFQGTWTTVDPSTFGPQTRLPDYGLCNALQITRPAITTTPTVSVFGNLLDLFKPTASAARPHTLGASRSHNLARQLGIPLR